VAIEDHGRREARYNVAFVEFHFEFHRAGKSGKNWQTDTNGGRNDRVIGSRSTLS
jgi:hypothetical protein